MNKVRLFFIIVILSIFSSCDKFGTKQLSAEETVKQSIECLIDKDYRGYLDLMYLENEEKLDSLNEKKNLVARWMEDVFKENDMEYKSYKIIDSQIHDSTALFMDDIKMKPMNLSSHPIRLRKNNKGIWKTIPDNNMTDLEKQIEMAELYFSLKNGIDKIKIRSEYEKELQEQMNSYEDVDSVEVEDVNYDSYPYNY